MKNWAHSWSRSRDPRRRPDPCLAADIALRSTRVGRSQSRGGSRLVGVRQGVECRHGAWRVCRSRHVRCHRSAAGRASRSSRSFCRPASGNLDRDVCCATRVCTTVLDAGNSQTTELVQNAGLLTTAELDDFRERFMALRDQATAIVLTGSLPRGTPPTIFAELMSGVQVPVVLDIRGPELLATLPHRPALVKPNREELEHTLSRPLSQPADVLQAVREIIARGAQSVLISQGKSPALLATAVQTWRLTPAPVERVVNPIGCGDCLAAGVAGDCPRGERLSTPCGLAWGPRPTTSPTVCRRYSIALGSNSSRRSCMSKRHDCRGRFRGTQIILRVEYPLRRQLREPSQDVHHDIHAELPTCPLLRTLAVEFGFNVRTSISRHGRRACYGRRGC